MKVGDEVSILPDDGPITSVQATIIDIATIEGEEGALLALAEEVCMPGLAGKHVICSARHVGNTISGMRGVMCACRVTRLSDADVRARTWAGNREWRGGGGFIGWVRAT